MKAQEPREIRSFLARRYPDTGLPSGITRSETWRDPVRPGVLLIQSEMEVDGVRQTVGSELETEEILGDLSLLEIDAKLVAHSRQLAGRGFGALPITAEGQIGD